jgi:hypothetical protein
MISDWDGFSKKQKIDFCKQFMLDNGFLVWGPLIYKRQVKTIPQLVTFFYDTMARYRDSNKIFHASPSKIDRGVLSNLIKSRTSLGMDKKRALSECCLFIEKLFEYENKLLDRPITSARVLGQDKMAWLTDRVWCICENYDASINYEKDKLWFEQLYNNQENVLCENDISLAIKKMDAMLESGVIDGQEK